MFKIRKPKDKGYVIAFVAILLLPILGFTSFSVDLGAWYAKAAELQKAADSAALAGAAFLPDTSRATAKAKELARLNGFDDDDGDISVTVFIPPADPKTISVSISIDEFPRYFSRVFENDELSLTRTSRAEYLPAPRMGSPRNFLGTGNCPGGTAAPLAGQTNTPFSEPDPQSCFGISLEDRENWWLAVNYGCTPRESGDRFASYIDGLATGIDGQKDGGGNSAFVRECQTETPVTHPYMRTTQTLTRHYAENPEYNSNGYYFGVTVKSPPGGGQRTFFLEGFSMGLGKRAGSNAFCEDGPTILQNYNGAGATPVERAAQSDQRGAQNPIFKMNWRLYYNGAFDPAVEPPLGSPDATVTVDSNNCGQFESWYTFPLPLTVGDGETKTYWLQVQPLPYEDIRSEMGAVMPQVIEGPGVNVFSLRVRDNVNFAPCSSLAGDVINYREDCPEIYAVENLPTFATFNLQETLSSRSFYLAQLPDEYINRTVSVEVFDPDPFTKSIQIGRAENFGLGGDFQKFKPTILCRDGSMAKDESCKEFSQRTAGGGVLSVGERPPQNVGQGGPSVSYNNMPETSSFTMFQGPAPLPASPLNQYVDRCVTTGPTFLPGCPVPGNTWFNSASNTPDTIANAISGLSTRTLRMSFKLGQPPVGASNEWWKINFNVSGENQVNTRPTDRMTWTMKVSGEPVRLLPTQIT